MVEIEQKFVVKRKTILEKSDDSFNVFFEEFSKSCDKILEEYKKNTDALDQAWKKNLAFYKTVIEQAISELEKNSIKNNTEIREIINAFDKTRVFSEEELNTLLAKVKSKRLVFCLKNFRKTKTEFMRECKNSKIANKKEFDHELFLLEKDIKKKMDKFIREEECIDLEYLKKL